MANYSEAGPPRLLVIDDNVAIHDDFRKVLCTAPENAAENEFLAAEAALFGEAVELSVRPTFIIDSAYQDRRGSKRRGKRSSRGSHMAWRSSTCACRLAGMASRPLSNCGR